MGSIGKTLKWVKKNFDTRIYLPGRIKDFLLFHPMNSNKNLPKTNKNG